MRIFVVWDLATARVRQLLEGLPGRIAQIHVQSEEGAGDIPIDWEIVLPDSTGRPVARSMFWRGIQQADRVLVLFDAENPSASVGWKIGLALGWRKPVYVACVGATLPAWTEIGALKAVYIQAVRDAADIARLLAAAPVALPAPEPQRALPSGIHNVSAIHDPGLLLLCPSGPAGQAVRDSAMQILYGCTTLPEQGWQVAELPKLLTERSGIVWLLTPDDHGGAVNAANAIVAGVGETTGCEVTVLRSAETPAVLDVQPRELLFRSLAELRQKLTPSRPPPEALPPPLAPPAPPSVGVNLGNETSGNIAVAPIVVADMEPAHTPPAMSRGATSEDSLLDKRSTRRAHMLLALAAFAMAIAGLLALRGTAPSGHPAGARPDAGAPDLRPR